jgi:hypothetical protein
MAMPAQRFEFSYGGLRLLMTVLGLGPGLSRIEVRPDEVVVKMGWGFRGRIPRSSIQRAAEEGNAPLSIGVHGWRGSWLVNGSSNGIVAIDVEPSARALVIGVPVKVRRLKVSAEDPAGLVAALGRG